MVVRPLAVAVAMGLAVTQASGVVPALFLDPFCRLLQLLLQRLGLVCV